MIENITEYPIDDSSDNKIPEKWDRYVEMLLAQKNLVHNFNVGIKDESPIHYRSVDSSPNTISKIQKSLASDSLSSTVPTEDIDVNLKQKNGIILKLFDGFSQSYESGKFNEATLFGNTLIGSYSQEELKEALGACRLCHILLYQGKYLLEMGKTDKLVSVIGNITEVIDFMYGDPDFLYQFVELQSEYYIGEGRYQKIVNGLDDTINDISDKITGVPPSSTMQIIFLEKKITALCELEMYAEALAILQNLPQHLQDYISEHTEAEKIFKDFEMEIVIKNIATFVQTEESLAPVQKRLMHFDDYTSQVADILENPEGILEAKGIALFNSHRYGESAKVFIDLLKTFPGNPKAQSILSEIAFILSVRKPGVLPSLSDLLLEGKVLFSLKKYDRARMVLQNIETYIVDNAIDRDKLKIMEGFREWKKAVIEAKGSILLNDDKYKEADDVFSEIEYESVSKLDEQISIMQEKIQALYDQQRWDEALAFVGKQSVRFKSSVLEYPKLKDFLTNREYVILENKGLMFLNNNEYMEAEKIFAKILRLHPEDERSKEILSGILAKIANKNTESPTVLDNLLFEAQILFDLKKYLEAEDVLVKLLKRYPENFDVTKLLHKVNRHIALEGSFSNFLLSDYYAMNNEIPLG